jgi:hypothetical protein
MQLLFFILDFLLGIIQIIVMNKKFTFGSIINEILMMCMLYYAYVTLSDFRCLIYIFLALFNYI